MNEFNLNLKGRRVVYKDKSFFKSGASVKERTFVCESGPGCNPDAATQTAVLGYWLADKMKDSVSSSSFDYVLDGEGKIQRAAAPVTVEVDVVQPIAETKSRAVRRKK